MPRLLTYRQRTTEERAKISNRVRGYKKWIDPFPGVHGTLPEKMVYARLSQLGIPFLFLNDITFNIPELEFNKDYQADFLIPSLNLIIEVQGAFWHSKPKTIEADAFKLAIYELKGYKVLVWWDYDIIANINLLVAASPELLSAARFPSSFKNEELPVQKRTKVDTSKGIRTLNQRRGQRLSYRKKSIKMKNKRKTKTFGGYSVYAR